MAGLPLKIATGIGITGALGGGGIYGFYRYSNTTDTVENYLKKNGFNPVSSSDASFWAKVLETYKLEKTNFEIESTVAIDANAIKTWCTTSLKQNIKSTDDSLFKKASKWCIEYKTIKEQLGVEKFETAVATLETKYSTLDTSIKSTIDKINITESDSQNGRKIKKWCDENANRRSSNDNKILFQNMEKICLKANQ